MRRLFVDTSAVLAFLTGDDLNHPAAKAAFERLDEEGAGLVTSSYVLVELYALVGRRLGLEAAKELRDTFEPLLEVIWVDAGLHARGLELWLARDRRQLSLVDCVSFLTVREELLDGAVAFDAHFQQEGIKL